MININLVNYLCKIPNIILLWSVLCEPPGVCNCANSLNYQSISPINTCHISVKLLWQVFMHCPRTTIYKTLHTHSVSLHFSIYLSSTSRIDLFYISFSHTGTSYQITASIPFYFVIFFQPYNVDETKNVKKKIAIATAKYKNVLC